MLYWPFHPTTAALAALEPTMPARFYSTQNHACRALAAAVSNVREDWDVEVSILPTFEVGLVYPSDRPLAEKGLEIFGGHLAAFKLRAFGEFARQGEPDAGKAAEVQYFAYLTR